MTTSLAALAGELGGRLVFVLAFLVVLSVVVFIHELGHFLVARWCGVKVSAFSIGFGKEIWGFDDRHGTRWRVAWLPLGGYVKFMDDDNAASVPTREEIERMSPAERVGSFHAKPVWQRAAVVAAGPIANFILAIAIFWVTLFFYGAYVMEPRIGKVQPGSPAEAAGFAAGDLIVSIDGRAVEAFGDLQHIVTLNPGRSLAVEIERGRSRMTLQVTPRLHEHDDAIAGKHQRPRIGIEAPAGEARKIVHTNYGPLQAFGKSLQMTWGIVEQTAGYLGDVVRRIQGPEQLGGIIRIADVSGQVAKLGPEFLINLIALLSVSVGLLNLLPIPVLDGGHLLFYAIEAVRRRPLSPRSQEIGLKIGLAVILALFIFTTINDLPILRKWLS